MDTELADRRPHPATTSLTGLASLAPPHPHDLAAAHQRTQAARTRHQDLQRQLQHLGRLRGWLQPQRAIGLRQQLRTVDQDQQRVGQQFQQARLRLRAIELRQDQRRSYVTCHRLELREGAAAVRG